jgi:hypothetical protein
LVPRPILLAVSTLLLDDDAKLSRIRPTLLNRHTFHHGLGIFQLIANLKVALGQTPPIPRRRARRSTIAASNLLTTTDISNG